MKIDQKIVNPIDNFTCRRCCNALMVQYPAIVNTIGSELESIINLADYGNLNSVPWGR